MILRNLFEWVSNTLLTMALHFSIKNVVANCKRNNVFTNKLKYDVYEEYICLEYSAYNSVLSGFLDQVRTVKKPFLCDVNINLKLRQRVVKSYIWFVLLYGVEAWTLKTIGGL